MNTNSEYIKGYGAGYKKGCRNNAGYKKGRLQGRSDIKYQVGRHLKNNDVEYEIVGWIRKSAKEFGFNCTFVDDDLKIICSLAARAIEAGLTDHLNPEIQKSLKSTQPPQGAQEK